jgi:glycosyltransferase involved in cell wall biosynthesis
LIDVILVTHRPKFEVMETVGDIIDNTPEPHRLIVTCQVAKSASVNRNYGLAQADSAVTVMLDDDITGFYPGWLSQIVDPLSDDGIALVSARLINEDGTEAPMMGGNVPFDDTIRNATRSGYKAYVRVPTAAIAFRRTPLRFDEGFIGSGYEDTAWMNEFNRLTKGRIVINNRCRLVHRNEEKNQGGPYFDHNHAHYMSLFPDDDSARCQRDWTKRNR